MAQPTDIREIVTKANERWNAAFNRGDADLVASLYTPDATVLPHTHAVVKGRAAIKDFWGGMIAAGVTDHAIELLDAQAAGDLAYATGKWSAAGKDEGGKAQQFGGTVVTVLRAQNDGSWMPCLHTWN